MRRVPLLTAAVLALIVGLAPAASASASSDLEAKLAAARSRANGVAAKLASAESALAKAEQEVAELKVRSAAAADRVAATRVAVRDLALLQYVQGTAPTLRADDMVSAARGRALLQFASSDSQDALEEFEVARADLETQRDALASRVERQRSAASALRKQRAAVQAELSKLAAAQKELEAKLAAERAKAAARPKATVSRSSGGATGVIASGAWICPVQGPRAFTNDWGQPRSGGRRHQGTDIMAPRGTPVVASVSGTVRHHSSSLGGLSYYLNGDDGHTYFGTHLNGYAASGRVAAGTVVGYVGNTGNARGASPHLHFEIHPGGGGPVNPYPTLSKHC